MRISICKSGGDEKPDPDRLGADSDRRPDDCDSDDDE